MDGVYLHCDVWCATEPFHSGENMTASHHAVKKFNVTIESEVVVKGSYGQDGWMGATITMYSW